MGSLVQAHPEAPSTCICKDVGAFLCFQKRERRIHKESLQEMGLSNGVGKIFIEKKKSGQVKHNHLSTLFAIHIYVYQ